jgi:DNA polymerase III subunit epsilon
VTGPTPHGPDLDEETLAVMIRAITQNGRYRVIERMQRRPHYHLPADGVQKKKAILVDVETTGLRLTDPIIQLAVLPFEFDRDGRIYAVGECEAWYEDPGIPIPEAVSRLTGITDDQVAGKKIDERRLAELVEDAVLVIAHNADFDRPRLERRLPVFESKHWACSYRGIPWIDEGLESAKLAWLAYRLCSAFYDAHRAKDDCYMTTHLLATTLPSGRLTMHALLETARRRTCRVWASQSPYETKDVLKERGYSWSDGGDGRSRGWWREVEEANLAAEGAWLDETVYGVRLSAWTYQRVTALDRHSLRSFDLPMLR